MDYVTETLVFLGTENFVRRVFRADRFVRSLCTFWPQDRLVVGRAVVKYHGRGGPWRPCLVLHC